MQHPEDLPDFSSEVAEIIEDRISFNEVARDAAVQASLRPVAIELIEPPKRAWASNFAQGLALVFALGLGIGTSAYLTDGAREGHHAASQPRALPRAEKRAPALPRETRVEVAVPVVPATPVVPVIPVEVEAPVAVAPVRPIAARQEPRPVSPPVEQVVRHDLPATPSREDVLERFASIRPAVLRCAEGRSGVASVRVSIGASGRVRGVEVGRDFAGTPEGSCIARVVRTARFPAFSEPSLTVGYPFVIP
jgi:hypothetical protein